MINNPQFVNHAPDGRMSIPVKAKIFITLEVSAYRVCTRKSFSITVSKPNRLVGCCDVESYNYTSGAGKKFHSGIRNFRALRKITRIRSVSGTPLRPANETHMARPQGSGIFRGALPLNKPSIIAYHHPSNYNFSQQDNIL